MKELRKTVCNRDCPDACEIVATVEDGRVTRLAGNRNHPVTRGFLCYRTSQFLKTQYSPDRLTMPLVRHQGKLCPIGWDQALDLAAEKLVDIRRESGPSSIFHYRSGGSLGMLKHLSDYFFEKFGPVTIKRGDICSGAGDRAQLTDFGDEDSHDVFDLLNSKSIILWGKNVYTSSPHLLPILKEAHDQRGTGLILIDPVHHRTAGICDAFIQPKPGGDFALAMAVARIIFDNQWPEPSWFTYCDHWEEFQSMVLGRSAQEWCTEADVPVDQALQIAKRLCQERPTAILVGWGMGRRLNGGAIVRALDALGAISGNLGVPGGGVSFYFKRRGAFDLSFIQGPAVAPRTVCEPLFGPELMSLSDPPIRAVWITAGNPVAMLPESKTTVEALKSRDFVVVVDSFLTDTAKLAHLVLPTTTLLEADDLLGAYGHHWLGVARPVVEPPRGAKSDLEIIQAIAQRVGLSDVMSGDARSWKKRMMSKLEAQNLSLEELERAPVRNPLVPKVLFEGKKFPTSSGKLNLITETPLPTEPPPNDYPLFLMSLSTPKAQSSQWAMKETGPAEATVHPDAATGIPDGVLAVLESPIGSLRVRVRHDPLQRRDVVIVPKGGHFYEGRCANALIRARTTDIGEGAALYDDFVRLVPDRV